MGKFRLILNRSQNCIEQENGATEGWLKGIWNELSEAITEQEVKPTASEWKEKLEALIDGLEIENKEKLINDGDAETYRMLGEVMSSKIKQMMYWR